MTNALDTAALPTEELVSAVIADLRPRVAQRWHRYYPDRTNEVPAVTFTPRHCGYSLMLRVDLDFSATGGRETLFIKLHRQQKHGSFLPEHLTDALRAVSRTEYEQHVKAHQFFARQANGLGVVRPLDFLESHHAVVVEHAAGRDLSELVKDGSPLANAALHRSGLWWRQFHHELHGARERAWDADAADAPLDRRLERMRRFGVPPDRLAAMRDEIRAVARRIRPTGIPVGVVHGDCKLRHVWATDDGIQVLDFGNTSTADVWSDPAALVAELNLYSLWSRSLDPGPKVAEMRTLLRAYFDGPPPPAFALYVVDCLLKKWHRRLRNWGPTAVLNRLHRSLRSARLDKPLERLYIDRWFTAQIRAWLDVADGRPPATLRMIVE